MNGVQLPQGHSHFEEAVYFLPQVPRNSLYSIYRPQKDERLNRPWSHPLVLNTERLDWELCSPLPASCAKNGGSPPKIQKFAHYPTHLENLP